MTNPSSEYDVFKSQGSNHPERRHAFTNPTCEVCGGLATHLVRDTESEEPIDSSWRTVRPRGPIHRFCDEHNRESVDMDVTQVFPLKPGLAL